MQPQDSNQEFQQPAPQATGAPYQAQNDEQPDASEPVVYAGAQLGSVAVADTESDQPDSQDDQAVLRWQGPEYVAHDRDMLWYIIFGVVTLALIAIAVFLIKSISFAILIPVMAVALFVYTRRAPQLIDYTLSRKGLHINDKMYEYGMFKSFAVQSHAGNHSALLIPRKRFQLGVTAYFPEEVGEPLVDMLAARLPMQTHTPDFVDRLLAKLRI